MLEENNSLPKKIPILHYLKNIDKDIDCENILDYIYNSKYSFCLSQFPQYISNNNKYNDLEIFFQKYLDGVIKKTDYLECEHRYHKVLQTLWLYNQVYVGIYTDKSSYKKSYYARKNRKWLRKYRNFILEIINDHESMQCINTLEELEAIMKIGTRDIAPILLFFIEYGGMIYFSGCSAIVYSKNIDFINLVKVVASSNGLYLLDSIRGQLFD